MRGEVIKIKTEFVNGTEYTTITELAESLSNGYENIFKQVRAFISQEINSSWAVEGKDFIKIPKEKIHQLNIIQPKGVLPSQFVLINVNSVPTIIRRITFKVNQLKNGEYKVDRFMGKKRSIYDELVYSLEHNDMIIGRDLFRATLSALTMIEEKGVTQIKAFRYASQKFGVTQKSIKEILDLVQFERKAQEKAHKNYGKRNKHDLITRNERYV